MRNQERTSHESNSHVQYLSTEHLRSALLDLSGRSFLTDIEVQLYYAIAEELKRREDEG